MVNYAQNLEKREIQKKIFPLITKKKMVSLAGPDLLNYLEIIPEKIQEIEVYEKDKVVMMRQLSQIEGTKKTVFYNFKDIINAEVRRDTFYDLDFCSSIINAEKHLRRFKDCAFTVTLALRPLSLEETLKRFFVIMDERIKLNIPHPSFNLVKTNKNSYLITTYYSEPWNMISIFKFHK